MLKLNGPKGNNDGQTGTLPFEPQPGESVDHYLMFSTFLEADPDKTPAQFFNSRDLSLDEWIPIAGKHNWITRRVDYWNYLALRQRAKWIGMLDESLVEFKQRLNYHYDRIEKAKKREKDAGTLMAEYDRVVKTLSLEMLTAKSIIEVLSASTKDGITIVNQQVGAINVRKDVEGIASAWEAGSKDVIEGVSRHTDQDSKD